MTAGTMVSDNAHREVFMHRSKTVCIRLSALLTGLLAATAAAPAGDKNPDWVENFGKSAGYPDGRFLTGYGMATIGGPVDRAACMQMAADNARAELVKKIKVGIQSVLLSQEAEDKAGYRAYVANTTKTTANMEIEGLDVANHIDENKKTCHSLALGSREKLSANYAGKVMSLQAEVKKIIAEAAKTEDRQAAIEKYLSAYPVLARMDEARVIAEVAGGRAAFAEPPDEASSRDAVRAAIERLIKHPVKDMPGAAWYVSYCLKEQKKIDGGVIVTPFNYRDTKMTSQFSRFLREILMQKLVEVGGWQVIDKPAGQAPEAKAVLYGSYWDQGGGVRVVAVLKRASDSRAEATIETTIPADAVKAAGLELRPQNFQQAYADMKVFAENEVQGGGLSVEAWTDRGDDNIVLSKGEKIKLFVRVNQPAYIRFIYHLADGRRALLLDNYYMDESKVNTVYQIPDEFECDAPFGSEVMQVYASNEKLPALTVKSADGYQILDEGLKSAVAKTRGLKKSTPAKALLAEKRISVTTMK
jgi:hypothetical protein